MTTFFTSDPHWGHKKVAEVRGFTTTREHDARLIEQWHDTVQQDDVVWVLGDLAASSPTYALNVMSNLPGRKHLIWGNHDKGHPMYRDSHKHVAQYAEVFESVQPFARRRIEGAEVLLSHFPYAQSPIADHTEQIRHEQYRLPDLGLPLLHGHTHSDRAFQRSFNGTPQVHVGVDAWQGRPASLDELVAMFNRQGVRLNDNRKEVSA